MLNIHHHFTLNQQVMIEDQRVLGVVHRSFDGILNGDKPELNLVRLYRVEYIGDRPKRDSNGICQVWLCQQSLFGEGSCWTKKANSMLWRHASRLRPHGMNLANSEL